ncbi:MAG: hypothetical protein QM729_02135 [Solirubrobacterales bacterium]
MSVRRRPEPDAEQGRRKAHANELLLVVAARLLGEARLAGAFPTGEEELEAFAARLAPELGDDEHIVVGGGRAGDEPPRSDYKVVLADARPETIHLSCRHDHRSEFGLLRIDGVLEEQGAGFGVGLDDPEQRIELSPQEQEVIRLASVRLGEGDARQRRADFRGAEFLRALAVDPQPGAVVQILAVELYGDGIAVRYTYDDPVDFMPTIPLEYYELAGVEPPLEDLLAQAEAEGGNLQPNVSVTDDLGTSYLNAMGGHGGVQVVHGEAYFATPVPAAATRLLVSTYAGTVDVDL